MSTRPDQRGGAGQRRRVKTEHAPQQRTPRERDGDEVRAAGERRGGERLGGRDEEHRIRRTAAGGASGRLGHGVGDGVDAEHQRSGFCRRARRDGSAVARTEIDDHPVGPGDQVVELADVDVDDAPADDLSHGPQSTLGP